MADQHNQDPPKRWAKVLVVDGVLALLWHRASQDEDDEDGYEIRCIVRGEGAETSIAISREYPFTQAEFDSVGDALARRAIDHATNFGMPPEQMGEDTP